MKKIIGSILLVIPLACVNPSQKETQIQQTAQVSSDIDTHDAFAPDTFEQLKSKGGLFAEMIRRQEI